MLPFTAGAISGLAVFYWWAEWGEGVGAYFTNSIAVAYTLSTLISVAIILTGYHYLAKYTDKWKTSRQTLQGYYAGWLLVFPFGLFLFPADTRHFPPPPQVRAMALALQQQLTAAQAPWEKSIPAQRTNTTFALLPAPKAIGLMPARPWVAQWHSQYSDGSSAQLRYFLNGLAQPRLISAQFIHAVKIQILEDPQTLTHHISAKPTTAPWTWALPNPHLAPKNVTATAISNIGIDIRADYPSGITIRWSRTHASGKTIEYLTYHAQSMPLPCRTPWQRIRLCLPPK